METPSSRWPLNALGDELALAARFLTRLPLGRSVAIASGSLAQAGWAFPVVGLGVGVLGAIAAAIAARLGFPSLVIGLIAVGVTVLVTGGLHEDGLADTADGLGGGSDREEKLAIMRDSRSGAYGVLALIFSVGLRAAALAALADLGHIVAGLIAAHAAARGFLPLAMRRMVPAREDGLGAAAGRPEAAIAWGAVALGGIIAIIALGIPTGVGALVLAAAGTALLAFLAHRQIGGHTGDVLGALEQTAEILVMVAAAAWAT
jgi:adenosylcobinamide-GDP ribazoletransferase